MTAGRKCVPVKRLPLAPNRSLPGSLAGVNSEINVAIILSVAFGTTNMRRTYLVGSPPVGFIVLQHPLPQHRHHLGKVFVGEGRMGQLLHDRPRWTPRLIVGCFAYFAFDFCVVHHNIGPAGGGKENGMGNDFKYLYQWR